MTNVPKGPVTEVTERCQKLEQDCVGLRDEYLRSLADFENFRKRMTRELEQVRLAAHAEVMTDLIPVLDNFARALAADGPKDNIRKGVEMIRQQLNDALSRHGLAEFSCLGQDFDPRRAEAVSFVETDQHAPDAVVEEHCPGYSCGERVIRPAKVVVARPFKQDGKSAVAESAERKAQDAESAGS